MSAPLYRPGCSPIVWALTEAAALERHAARMAASHGVNTPGVAICKERAAALRWLADAAKGSGAPLPASPPTKPTLPSAAAAAAIEAA